MTLPGEETEDLRAGAGKLKIDADGQVSEWLVLDSSEQACAAARHLSGDAAKYCQTQRDLLTGLGYWPVLHMRRQISLDNDDYTEEVSRLTWLSELEDALVDKAGTSGSAVSIGNRLREAFSNNKELCLKVQASDGRMILEGFPPDEETVARDEDKPFTTRVKTQKGEKGNLGRKKEVAAKKVLADMWGEVFIQKEGLGYASYHFEQGEAYISYAKTKPGWNHDDGSKYPKKKYFSEISYDTHSRVFKGVIDWSPKTVKGAERWVYKMIFDPGFTRISAGTISFYAPGAGSAPLSTAQFGKQVEYKRKSALDETLAAEKKRIDPTTEKIMEIMGQTFKKYDESSGGQRPSPQKSLQLVFGESMQTFVRDVEADRRRASMR